MIDVRQNFEAYRLGTLTARETICIAAAITAISFLFAWLLDVAFSQRQQISASSQRALFVENSNPYYLYLHSRFSVYFSHDTYSKTFLHPSDFQQEIAAVSLTSMPSLSTLALVPTPPHQQPFFPRHSGVLPLRHLLQCSSRQLPRSAPRILKNLKVQTTTRMLFRGSLPSYLGNFHPHQSSSPLRQRMIVS